jgi:hypothetical protein
MPDAAVASPLVSPPTEGGMGSGRSEKARQASPGLNRYASSERPMDSLQTSAAPKMEETLMKANICFGLAVAALVTTVAAPAMADTCVRQTPMGGHRFVQCPGGFGDRLAVTLPPDRHPPSGTNTGIAIGNGAGPNIPPPMYFRPR